MKLSYNNFQQDLASLAGTVNYSETFLVKEYIKKAKLDLLYAEFRPFNWGVSFKFDNTSNYLTIIVALLQDAFIANNRLDLFYGLWRKILQTQLRDCLIYRKYANRKNANCSAQELSNVRAALAETQSRLEANLKSYLKICAKFDLQEDNEEVCAALELIKNGKLPKGIFQKPRSEK